MRMYTFYISISIIYHLSVYLSVYLSTYMYTYTHRVFLLTQKVIYAHLLYKITGERLGKQTKESKINP